MLLNFLPLSDSDTLCLLVSSNLCLTFLPSPAALWNTMRLLLTASSLINTILKGHGLVPKPSQQFRFLLCSEDCQCQHNLVIYHCITTYPKFSSLKQLHSFQGSGIWEWLYWVVLVQCLQNTVQSWQLSQLENLLPGSHCWLEASVPLQMGLCVLQTWCLAFSEQITQEEGYVQVLREHLARKLRLLQPNHGNDVPSLLPYAIGHTDQHWYSVGGNCPRVWIPKDKDHWGPSWVWLPQALCTINWTIVLNVLLVLHPCLCLHRPLPHLLHTSFLNKLVCCQLLWSFSWLVLSKLCDSTCTFRRQLYLYDCFVYSKLSESKNSVVS